MDLKQERQLTVMVDSNNVSAGFFWGRCTLPWWLEDETFPFGTLRPIFRGYVKLVPRKVSLIFFMKQHYVTICFTLSILTLSNSWRHFEDPPKHPALSILQLEGPHKWILRGLGTSQSVHNKTTTQITVSAGIHHPFIPPPFDPCWHAGFRQVDEFMCRQSSSSRASVGSIRNKWLIESSVETEFFRKG